MGQKVATLETELLLDVAQALRSLAEYGGATDKATQQAIAMARQVDDAIAAASDTSKAQAGARALGDSWAKAGETTTAAQRRIEQQVERMIVQLERQTASLGKSTDELRAQKIEMLAAAAAAADNTDAVARLTVAHAELIAKQDKMRAAAEAEAQAVRDAAQATQLFEANARRMMQLDRERDAKQAADAALQEAAALREAAFAHGQFEAAARRGMQALREAESAAEAEAREIADLRARLDPAGTAARNLASAIDRLRELEAKGAISARELAEAERLLTLEHNASAAAGGKNAFALKQVGMQLPDIFEGLATGQKPMQVFIQQGSQIAQVAMMAEGGVKGLATQVALLSLRFAPLAVIAGVAFGAVKLFQAQVKDDGDLTRYRDGLGLTHKEMLQLSDGVDKAGDKISHLGGVTVTFGDVMAGIGKTVADGLGSSSGWDHFKDLAVSAFKKVLDAWNVVSAGITAGIYGTFDAVKVAWGSFPAVFGDLFVQGVNAAIGALNRLVKLGIDQLNTVITTANKLPGVNLGTISAPQIAPVDNAYAGAAAKAAEQIGASYSKAYGDARKADAAFWKQVGDNARQHAKDRMAEEAAAIKEDRTPKKPHEDKHAEALAREAAAEEAQIKNLGLLAAAYDQSGAAALVAEAREKAESKAIKDRGDIEAEVSRQVRLAIAQRITDAAKSTAALNNQAAVQEEVNAQVAAGLVPEAAAADLLQQRIAVLPLVAAQEAAIEEGRKAAAAGDTTRAQQFAQQAQDAGKRIDDLTAAQKRSNDARREAQFLQAQAGADNDLERLVLETRLIGVNEAARVHALATLKAWQEAQKAGWPIDQALDYVRKQVAVADATETAAEGQRHWNEQLGYTADHFAKINETAQLTGDSMADAFGKGGKAAGDALTAITGYYAQQSKLQKDHDQAIRDANGNQASIDKANADYQRQSDDARMSSLIGLTSAAKGFFKENSTGYKAMETAEKALTLVQLARTAVDVAGGAAKMFAELGPWAFPAVAAMLGVMASLGFSGGGGGVSTADFTKGNTGTGTVLGDNDAQSASIKNAIEALKGVDDATLTVSRDMLLSLRSIENSLGGLATQLVRAGDINADGQVKVGMDNSTGKAIGAGIGGAIGAAGGTIFGPVGMVIGSFIGSTIGKLIGSLFGTKTKIVGNGLYGGSQSVGDILDGGFDAQYYTDEQKKKKFFGVTTSTKLKTVYSAADDGVADQFTLLIKQFYDTIGQAAAPLGQNLDAVQAKLQGFTVDIGKIDLKGLTGDQIEEKLEAVFGAAADSMAEAAFPGIEKFQKVGEGAFETLVRVATTVDQVDAAFRKLGVTTTTMGTDVDMAVADLFDSVSDFTSAAGTYFQDFYTKGEQASAESNEIARAMSALGLAMPDTLAGFRDLVSAQDLTTDAGQQTYATLLKLAPAFFDLKTNLEGAKSAADILSEQQDLQGKLWDLLGDTADIRAAELAKLDPSNRALQEEIYSIQDAQDAAKAASDLADAWKTVGDSIKDEIDRIRGLGDDTTGAGFAQLLGQFNAATAAARAGDQDAAKSLPTLSKSLLDAAATAATSRQELDRVQAETAASLQETYDAISDMSGGSADASSAADVTVSSTSTTTSSSGTDLASEIAALRAEVVQLRNDNNAGHAATAENTGKASTILDRVTRASSGAAVAVTAAAA